MLLNCVRCHDLVRIMDGWRPCSCGSSKARRLADGGSVEVSGHGRVLGLDGSVYKLSLVRTGVEMELFVMADSHPRIRRIRGSRA